MAVLDFVEVMLIPEFRRERLHVKALIEHRIVEEVVGPVVRIDVAEPADRIPHLAPNAKEGGITKAQPLGAIEPTERSSGEPSRVSDVLLVPRFHIWAVV